MDVEIKWNKTSDQIAKEKTRGNDGLLFLANEAKRLMDPYVPADSLALAQNVSVHVEGDTGVIELLITNTRAWHTVRTIR